MNNRQVAHVWAQQRRESGKGSNFFFRGPTLFSYGDHFIVARFTDATLNGERVVLFNTNTYSISTTRHQSYARDALRGLNVRVIAVNEPDVFSHAANLADMETRANALLMKASRARKYAAMHTANAERIFNDAADYCAAFNVDVPAWLAAGMPEDIRNAMKARAADMKAAQQREREELAREFVTIADEWRNGEREHIPYKFADMPTMLRVNAGADVIETSRGAEVPVAVARNLWRVIKAAHDAGESYIPRGRERVGDFSLTRVNADGSAIIGCHTLEFDELQRMAQTLGIAQ